MVLQICKKGRGGLNTPPHPTPLPLPLPLPQHGLSKLARLLRCDSSEWNFPGPLQIHSVRIKSSVTFHCFWPASTLLRSQICSQATVGCDLQCCCRTECATLRHTMQEQPKHEQEPKQGNQTKRRTKRRTEPTDSRQIPRGRTAAEPHEIGGSFRDQLI